jgi:hypothetical protein
MAVIAVAAVALVVVAARVAGGGTDDEDDGLEGGVPSTLVGGIEPTVVPGAVLTSVDQPVIGAAHLDEVPPEVMDSCAAGFGEVAWAAGDPKLDSALATTDSLQLSVIGAGQMNEEMGFDTGGGPQPERFRITCTARDTEDGWQTDSNGFEPIMGDQQFEQMGGGSFCCDENGLGTATEVAEAPEGADWALQERGGWYLAYPVDKDRQVLLTWKYREQNMGPGGPPTTTVMWVGGDGTIVGETSTGGQF